MDNKNNILYIPPYLQAVFIKFETNSPLLGVKNARPMGIKFTFDSKERMNSKRLGFKAMEYKFGVQ